MTIEKQNTGADKKRTPTEADANNMTANNLNRIWAKALAVTDLNCEEIKRRNNLLLNIIRQRANEKKINGVVNGDYEK